MTQARDTFYVSTPIYYVNDKPHIGHVYTTTIADILACYHRLRGDDVFFLTGTDEHAAKVSDKAAENGLTAQAWADLNAASFQDTFKKLRMTNTDFIRTSQDRHRTRVADYVQKLLDTGDVYEGEYEGWYDAGQEEYLPENKAAEYGFKSPINGKDLVRKKELNYFFKLSAFQDRLLAHIEANPDFIEPTARRNEVLGRIREGLNDVPVSRTGTGGWGIQMPNNPDQTIYVWIDALCNYLTTVDNDDRRKYWPANVHLIAKDILWFHAVIWPCTLMALDEPLPEQVYAHSFWISEGKKMSKSLGNFIDLTKIDWYVENFGLDALRYFLATQGPLGSTDADFAHDKFVEVYNTDLANTIGNCGSRVTNMIARYFDGELPSPGPTDDLADQLRAKASGIGKQVHVAYNSVSITAAANLAMDLVRAIDSYIEQTQPFKMAKDESKRDELATVLYHCAETLRIASLILSPIMPQKMTQFWALLGTNYDLSNGSFMAWAEWGQLQPGSKVTKGQPLFPKYQPPKEGQQ